MKRMGTFFLASYWTFTALSFAAAMAVVLVCFTALASSNSAK